MQDRPIRQEGQREVHLLAGAPRQVTGHDPFVRRGAELVEDLVAEPKRLRVADPGAATEHDERVVRGQELEQSRRLGAVPDPPVDVHRAGIGANQAGTDARERALPGTRARSVTFQRSERSQLRCWRAR